MAVVSKKQLTADASNRSLRALLIGLSTDVAVGIALVLVTFFAGKNDWGSIQWGLLSFSLFKSIMQAVGSFVLRRFVDASKFPTPLPPDPQPAPAE